MRFGPHGVAMAVAVAVAAGVTEGVGVGVGELHSGPTFSNRSIRQPAEALKLTESIARDPTQWEAQLVAGSAAMALARPAEAAAFFKAIVDRRTKLGINICIPIALNKLARAQAAVGDKAAARATYEELFKLWQRADADVPLLVEAKKQYAALSS